MGRGSFGDPKETFKMYAPPTLLDVFTPEQQEAYGRQIQQQTRYINPELRADYGTISKNISDAAAARVAQTNLANERAALEKLFNPQTAPAAPVTPGTPPAGTAMPAAPNAAPAQATMMNPRAENAKRYFAAGQYFASRGDGEKAKKYVDMGLSLHPNPSEAVRDLEYFGFQMQGQQGAAFDRLKQLNESKANKTTNVLSTGRKAEDAYAETLAKDLPGLASQAQLAQRTNESLAEIVGNENKSTFSGLLAPGQIGATQFLQSFGVNIKPETLANSREFQANANILVLDFMGAMGGARGFSKEESAILYDAFPKIIDSPQARSRIARMLISRNNRLINDYNATRKEFENMVGRPSPSPQIKPFEFNAPGNAAKPPRYNPKSGEFE